MINYELINQKFLAQELDSLERGYVETVINLIKGPVFIASCKNALESAEDERKEALEKVLAAHEKNQKDNEEAIDQLNEIITEVKKLIK